MHHIAAILCSRCADRRSRTRRLSQNWEGAHTEPATSNKAQGFLGGLGEACGVQHANKGTLVLGWVEHRFGHQMRLWAVMTGSPQQGCSPSRDDACIMTSLKSQPHVLHRHATSQLSMAELWNGMCMRDIMQAQSASCTARCSQRCMTDFTSSMQAVA